MGMSNEEMDEDLVRVDEHPEEGEGFFIRSRLKPQVPFAPRNEDIFHNFLLKC